MLLIADFLFSSIYTLLETENHNDIDCMPSLSDFILRYTFDNLPNLNKVKGQSEKTIQLY